MDPLHYGTNHTASSGHSGMDKTPHLTPGGATPTQYLTWGNVFIAFCFLGADAILSIYLHLGISRSLLIAALRCVTQLYIMSLILDRIFAAQSPWGVAAMVIVLNLLAAYEVTVNKAKRRFEGMFIITLTSMAVSCVPCFAIASRFALNQDPWWVPAKFIPALGMALGNAISGVTITTACILESFHTSRASIEVYLSHGATRYEACLPLATSALRLALLPMISNMSVIGLVSLPGMFVGSVLAGADTDTAFKLQVIIIFCLNASTAAASLAACVATCAVMVDPRGRIRSDKAWNAKTGRPPAPPPHTRINPAGSVTGAKTTSAPKWYDAKGQWNRVRRRNQGDIRLPTD